MKVASSALARPNDAMAKNATSAMLAILIASSRISHQISELSTIIHQLKRECNIDRLGEELGSAEFTGAALSLVVAIGGQHR